MDSPSDVRSDGSITPRPLPFRGHRRHRRRETFFTNPSTGSQAATALLRSPTAPQAPREDGGLLQSGSEQRIDPGELSRLLQAHLDSQDSVIEEEDDVMAASSAFPPLDTSMTGGNRASSSPTIPHAGGSVNGNGVGASGNYMAPLPVGHQQDLNFLYAQIQELGGILRSNRDKVNVITRNAEEVARRANGAFTENEGSQESDKARIRELERELAKANHTIGLYKHEQSENTNLIAMYEDAMGTATEQVRNFSGDIEGRFLAQRKHYNNLLQQEKDEHLQSRLDRDHWHAQTLRVCEMIRTALRLRTDEWCEEYTIISGLQSEVRCLRRCLGMEAEKPEEETGWPYLKDLPLNDQA